MTIPKTVVENDERYHLLHILRSLASANKKRKKYGDHLAIVRREGASPKKYCVYVKYGVKKIP